MSHLNSRGAWAALASAALAVALVFLGTMLAGSPHVWAGNLMVTAYALAAAAVTGGLCGELGVRFPVLGERRRWRTLGPAETIQDSSQFDLAPVSQQKYKKR